MDTTTRIESVEGTASPMAVMLLAAAVIALCYGFFTLALPGAHAQLVADTCALVQQATGSKGACGAGAAKHVAGPAEQFESITTASHNAFVSIANKPDDLPVMPAGAAMSVADEHLQAALAFNAALDHNVQQVQQVLPRPELTVQVQTAGYEVATR